MDTDPLLPEKLGTVTKRHGISPCMISFRRFLERWRGILLALLAALIWSTQSIIIRLDQEFDFIAISFVAMGIQSAVTVFICLWKRLEREGEREKERERERKREREREREREK